jgi:peptidoglycan/xylan/chitin deacetylase (PgdA/CDA1 family)
VKLLPRPAREPHGGGTPAIDRRVLLGGAASVCLLSLAVGTAHPETWRVEDKVPRVKTIDPLAITGVATDAPLVALTFDDGPDPAYTPTVLDILREHRVTATFFMIGRLAAAHPELVQRVLREGHTIANHTADHLWLDRLTEPEVRDQVQRGTSLLSHSGASPNGYFRPPRGLTSPTVAAVTRSLDVRSVFWGTCLEANLSHHSLNEAALVTAGRCQPGTIILAHDGGHLDGPNPQSIDRSPTVTALPELIHQVREQELDFEALPVLRAGRRRR